MSYLLSVLGLAVACIAWYGVQRIAGSEPPSCRRNATRDCEGCDAEEACTGASPRRPPSDSSPTMHDA